MENYVQQSEGTSLMKHGSFIDLASYAKKYLQDNFYLQNIVSDIITNILKLQT